MNSSHIPTLDGIRGLAILFVVAGHLVQNYQPLDDSLRHWLFILANPAGGVRLFFVLSGYLITWLLLQEYAKAGTVSLRRFYGRRALRIFPAFYAYLLVAAAWYYFTGPGLAPAPWLAAGTFAWNYAFLWIEIPPGLHWDLGHLWTLALEQQFYLVWPLLLLLARPRGAGWVALGLIAWCPLARVGSYFLFPAQRGLLGMMFHTAIDSLMVGCAAAIAVHSEAFVRRLRSWGPPVALIAALWLLLLSPLAGATVRGFSIVAGITLDACAAAWIIAWVHQAPSPRIAALLGRGLLPALGTISYSLYLWQQLFLAPERGLAGGHVLLPLAGAVAAALTSYWFIEQPALRWKARLGGLRHQPRRPSAAPPSTDSI